MRGRRGLALLLVGLLLVPAGAMGVGATPAKGNPSLSVYAPSNELTPGQPGSLTLQIANSGEVAYASPGTSGQVTTARAVAVELRSNVEGIDVKTGQQSVGSIQSGGLGVADFQVVTAEDVSPGTYELTAEVDYEYTEIVTQSGAQQEDDAEKEFDVTVRVTDDARFAVVDVESDVAVGQSGDVNVTVENVGASTARDASVTLQSTSSSVVFGGAASATRYAGGFAPGETRTFSFEATVAPDTPSADYALQATVDFEGTDGVPDTDGPFRLGLRPGAERTVDIRADATDLGVGTEGSVTLQVTNDGPSTLHDATIAFQPGGETVAPVEAERVVGTLDPGASTTVEYPLRVTGSAEPGPRRLTFAVDYENDAGDAYRTDPVDLVAEVAPEQSFSLTGVEHSLRVGEEGELRGTVVNEGPGPARDAVLRLEAGGQSILPQETEYAVGSLESGASADFAFPIDVSAGAAEGPRQLSVTVAYDTDDGTAATSDPLSARADVAPSRDVFVIESGNTSIEAGESGTATVSVTNNRDVVLRNVNAQAFVDDPLSADTEEAYIPRLAPGETTEIEFDLSVASGASARPYPLEMDFQYDEPDGDTKLSDTYQATVRVTESTGGGGFLSTYGLPLGLVGLLALAGAGFVYTRQ
ncbi:COG1361 S-layer family protein [Haloglomus halophilum]|uniref:COG1361 S-layer family protein n=1 Tax=Haloglomus halophilum TaxID=2962672 RepID=UPI0020C9FD03|nr:CARDB domain-containing protein [Haloglomus halophilum]